MRENMPPFRDDIVPSGTLVASSMDELVAGMQGKRPLYAMEAARVIKEGSVIAHSEFNFRNESTAWIVTRAKAHGMEKTAKFEVEVRSITKSYCTSGTITMFTGTMVDQVVPFESKL